MRLSRRFSILHHPLQIFCSLLVKIHWVVAFEKVILCKLLLLKYWLDLRLAEAVTVQFGGVLWVIGAIEKVDLIRHVESSSLRKEHVLQVLTVHVEERITARLIQEFVQGILKVVVLIFFVDCVYFVDFRDLLLGWNGLGGVRGVLAIDRSLGCCLR